MALEQFGKGCCINCGYLGKRLIRATDSTCYEASDAERLAGRIEPVGGHGTRPWCFMDKVRIYEELAEIGAQEHEADKVKQLLIKVRNCAHWYPYRLFLNPKEHYEEFKMYDFEKRREEFDLKLFEMSKRIQEDSKNIVEKSDKFNRRVTIWIIILACLEVFGTIMALNYPNGWPW